MSGDFRLSATLRGHEEDVRAIVFASSDLLFSASRDNTVRQWKRTAATPPTFADTIALQGSHWFNGLAVAPPSKESPDGVLAAGGRDTFVYIKQIGTPPEEDAHRMLIGHAGNIACLAFSEDGGRVISGAWDSQVFVWDVENGSVVAELAGHQGPVWAIMVYDAETIVTACADKIVRIFDAKSGKVLQSLKGHTDVARALCKLPDGHWSGAALASAGNDEVIRLWTLDGLELGQLDGHAAYIYDLAILPNGDIVSSSEDRTVRVWRDGQCIQTITHPAISIWTVEACDNGDIASGASDNTIRIFSRDPERQADAETIAAFDETNRMHAIPAQTANQGLPFEKETLPGPEALQTQTGKKDGQQLLVRENDGSVTAHLWSASTGQWNLIGTVVEGEGTGSSKKVHEGKEYDYVFDIDIEDGKPPLKLAYNLTESAWDAARRFLESNKLPMTYYDQVANWIMENTRGSTLGQDSVSTNQAPPPGHDPYGTERRYRPGDAPSGPRTLPQRNYSGIVEGNPANAINIIISKTEDLIKSGDIKPEQGLSADEIAAIKALPAQLQNKQDPRPTAVQINGLLMAASQWPQKARVPAVGVLAVCAVSPSFVSATSEDGQTIIDIITSAGLLQPRQETANNVVHTIRLLVNLFRSDAGRQIMASSFETVLQLVRHFASEPESPAQVKALATLYLNYAVLLTSGGALKDAKANDARASTLLTDIAVQLEGESPHASDGDALFRTLSALGTLIHLSEDFKQSLKGGISGSLHFVAAKPAAQTPNNKELIQEIRDALR